MTSCHYVIYSPYHIPVSKVATNTYCFDANINSKIHSAERMWMRSNHLTKIKET